MFSKLKYHIIILILIEFVFSCKDRVWDNPNDPKSRNYQGFQFGSMSDIEGNIYKTVLIGIQNWMAENLKTLKYSDGSYIPNITDNTSWATITYGAYCWYNNDISNMNIYGALYNWYAVNTGKLCPTGWHVPSDSEWSILENTLGGKNIAGGSMKAIYEWNYPNTGASNSSGFSGLPAGYRSGDGTFYGIRNRCFWWSSSEEKQSSTNSSWYRHLHYISENLSREYDYKVDGLSIRCIKD